MGGEGKGGRRDGEGGGKVGPQAKASPQNYFPGAGADYRSSIAVICRSPLYLKKIVALGIPASHVLFRTWRAPELGSYATDMSIDFYYKSPALSIDANEYDVNNANVY